jgi:hypothetical protein
MADPLEVIRNERLVAGPPTPGMKRSQAFEKGDVWMGKVRTDLGVTPGWHHHGEHAT